MRRIGEQRGTNPWTRRVSGQFSGVVLAAGAGTRRGGPKALASGPEGPWLVSAVQLLVAGGCDPIVVVLGAGADAARELVPDHVVPVVAAGWHRGASESLRTGLAHAIGDAVVVTLVDLPGTPVSVVRRVIEGGVEAGTLRQAVYGGRPGHPVVLGRDHWEPLVATLRGDEGARRYLRAHGAETVECGDLHHGDDVDL